jgi:hypothetical protein
MKAMDFKDGNMQRSLLNNNILDILKISQETFSTVCLNLFLYNTRKIKHKHPG